jgi:hypothetical protein
VVPDWFIKYKEEITLEKIINEPNMELRKCMVEISKILEV